MEKLSITLHEFRQRLAETIAWCKPRALNGNPKNSLRTQVFRPLNSSYFGYGNRPHSKASGINSANVVFEDDFDDMRASSLVCEDDDVRIDLVEELGVKRRKLLEHSILAPSKDSELLEGRLLLFFPESSTDDGLSEMGSQGYFDSSDNPPWDTWIQYIAGSKTSTDGYSSFLISWVPPSFIQAVQSGLENNALLDIQWAQALQYKETVVPQWFSPYCRFQE